MSDPAFTPGPWKFIPWHIAESASEVRAPDGWLVCATSSDANAKLIAAAPDLYEALEWAVRQIPTELIETEASGLKYDGCIHILRKARGDA